MSESPTAALAKEVVLLKGDGIGPEIVSAAVQVLDRIAKRYGHDFIFSEYPIGGRAVEICGNPLPQETLAACRAADCVLLGAVGGPAYDDLPAHQRPETGLLALRSALGLYANLRPVRLFPQLAQASPLHMERIAAGFDILIVRELTGGIYFGERGRRQGSFGEEAFDTESYSKTEIERISHVAFRAAQSRNKSLISVDKANVLESSRLWRETVHRLSSEYPEVTCVNMLVDNAAMQLIRDPAQFDVLLTSNLFGDILSDEASQLTGSIGMLASASVGEGSFGLYEPIHGSAPDIAGKDIANPIATILSAAMLLRHSLQLEDEAIAIETAVESVLDQGLRTADIAVHDSAAIGTQAMTEAIVAAL